ncbi:hypothetical protein [Lysobacter sp. CCNWLW3]|uniref:hypothetical protein n=1 Tax=Lysobacter sp. CCNWLW3 TaxID=3117014 RepID=UPI002FD235DA
MNEIFTIQAPDSGRPAPPEPAWARNGHSGFTHALRRLDVDTESDGSRRYGDAIVAR